jgi:heme exporter protein CcmD
MSTHWLHVTLSWGVVALAFGALVAVALSRHAAAKRRLAQLEPRA